MDFFGVGPLEILLVLVIGLMALGPGKMPELARSLSKGLRALRKATQDLTAEVTKELKELDEETGKEQKANDGETAPRRDDDDSSARGAPQ
jgi:Tat protein translocase TatB subunit